MKFRGVMAEHFAMKDFQNVANILSNFSKHCIFRIIPEKVCCIASDDTNRPTLWCELPRDYYFTEYRMEGVSSEHNEIFIEFMPAMLYRCLSGSRNAARLLKLKLMNKQTPCLSVEIELPSSGLVSSQQCIHDIPVDVIPKNLWNDYAMPQQLTYDALCPVYIIPVQRSSPVLDWIRCLHYSSLLEAVFIVNTTVTMISKRDQFRKCFKRAQSLLLQEVINEVDNELRKKEPMWVRNWISERDQKGGSVMLLQQLKVEDPNEYRLALDWPSTLFQLHWIDRTEFKSRPRIQLLDWNAYWIQCIPIVIDLPNLKALKNIIERMKSMSQYLIVKANKDGRFSLSIETAMTTVTAHFPNRQVYSFTGKRSEDLEISTAEKDDLDTVSAKVEIKTFYTFLSTQQISYNKAVCCIVRHRLVQLKLERQGAISLQCLLPDI